jgi:two-component system OmpR family sensor kinase
MLRNVALFLLGLTLSAGIASFGAGWWLASRMIHPVDDIIDQAESIGVDGGRRAIEAYADTREYQRLVQVLNGMLARLDSAMEAQRRFTADASHELRSPLTALRGELEVARRKERSREEYERVLDSSLDEVERLSRIAEDLLTLTRSEAGVVVPQEEVVDLGTRVGDTITRLARKAAAKEVRVHLVNEGPVTTRVDPDLLDRVSWNLLDNAIKFTPAGGEVTVTEAGEDRTAVLSVADTGPGIPEDRIPQVFERFFRLDESRTPGEREGGTGLGLAIVRALSELSGGRVEAANGKEGGAVFRVLLPLMKEPS